MPSTAGTGHIASTFCRRDAAEWNAFVRTSRNGTFLFDRDFMDYHGDRYLDASIMLRDGRGRLRGVMPCNLGPGEIQSHAGLTYGGLVVHEAAGVGEVLSMFRAIRLHASSLGLRRLSYKCIPWIYHRYPTEEDRYALHRMGASLADREVLSVLCPADFPAWQTRRLRGMKRAMQGAIVCEESSDFDGYWEMLDRCLAERHGAAPVHCLQEMLLLHRRFPRCIRLFVARTNDALQAGVLVFETEFVARSQYIASSPEGREAGALDALFGYLISDVYRGKRWFDFGSSGSPGGGLNPGLIEQKEGFGARTVVQDRYVMEIAPT